MGASSAGPTRGALPAAYAVGSLGGSSPAGAEGPPREPTAGFAANVPLGGGAPGPARWSGAAGGPSPTVPAAEANRSSRESPAAAGPVSSFASSYNCAHQSTS
ncbi:hypothetical protein ACIG3E_20820 [Streptomyces sp. NPDC053474]|uniref:hypothetical protein n=1 Tax=Streptomyces sp. NPDC053474 TaxID=3365704 RepID=UPI0037D273A2